MHLNVIFFKAGITDQTSVAMRLNMANMFAICLFLNNGGGLVVMDDAPRR